MRVFTDITQLPAFRNAVVTIGTFDGVHLGHRTIIDQMTSEAARTGGETVIITFDPHPRKIVENRAEVQLLTTISEKARLFEKLGVDNLVIIPFTKEFSEQSPESYVEDFLYSRFRPSTVIIGYDHKFGKGRGGDYRLLEQYSRQGLFELKEIPQQLIDDNAVSSTRIRAALYDGDITLANRLLGYDFFFEGQVVKGDQRGRTIGFPTANLQLSSREKILPGNGVYAVAIERPETHDGGRSEEGEGRRLKGMMNIGVRPTVDGTKRTIEVNLFNFDEQIYGETLRVNVKYFLRKEQKFDGLDQLKAQLANDKQSAIRLLD